MLKSMTGYGRAQKTLDGRDILVEIKSVNHRYFEFNARIPRSYGYIEDKLKTLAAESISRGKVDMSVSIYTVAGKSAEISINSAIVKGYIEALRSVKDEFSLNDDLSLSAVARMPDVFNIASAAEDEDVIWGEVKAVAVEAVASFMKMRENEGEKLLEDIKLKLDSLERLVGEVEEKSPQTVADYRARLTQKLNEILENKNIDEARILTEAAVFAERVAVDEETVRLRSHIKQFRTLINSKTPVGKKLDFIVQEMNREVNTTGSKCQDAAVTAIVIEMKSEIEKIREQIQNIE